MDLPVFDESITLLFKKLCIKQLKNTADKKRALVINKNFEECHIGTLKKHLYRKLFVALHSPVILPTFKELTENDVGLQEDKENVYNNIAEEIFHLRIQGSERNAEELSFLCHEMKCFDSQSGDNALKFIQLLSNSIVKDKKSSRAKYSKNDFYENNMFQFDEKAMQIDESGIDLFGSAHDVDNNSFSFNSDVNRIFSFVPGTQLSNIVSSKALKESTYSEHTRCSLFDGLTNSLTTSMEVVLNLPKLPEDTYDMMLPLNIQDLYSKEQSIDEGFDELSITLSEVAPFSFAPPPHRDIWDKAATLEKRKVFSWEREGSYDPRSNSGYLTELGDKAFDCMYTVKLCEVEQITGKTLKENTVSQERVFLDSLNVLIGIQSLTYSFHPATFSMKPATNIRCTGISSESLNGLMTKFALLGTNYRQLRKFCSHHAERPVTGHSGGSLLKAFIDALNRILQTYWYAVFTVADLKNLSLTELWHLFERFSRQLQLLADICLCSEAFKRRKSNRPKFPVGPGLLSYLYSLSAKNTSTEHYHLLLYLFKSASLPYIKFISNWLFNGLCSDCFGEFFVFMDQQYLSYRDKFFWTQGFQIKQSKNAVPLFLDDMAVDIFACGKAINLLRLTNIQHYLFDQHLSPPVLTITFSSDRLDVIDQNTKKYIQRVKERQRFEEKQREIKKLEEEELWKTKLADEKALSEEALEKIKDMENDIHRAIKEKKVKELHRLKEQFLEGVEERKKKRQRKLEEDEKFLNEVKQMEGKQDEIKQKARDELIAFYQALSDKADRRERHARWTIERYELSNKRLEFLSRGQAQLEEEVKRSKQQTNQNDISPTLMSPVDEIDNIKPANKVIGVSVSGKSTESTKLDDQSIPNLIQSVEHPPINQGAEISDQNTSEAKDLLYPSSASAIPMTAARVNQRQVKEGAETKSLLYPCEQSNENDETEEREIQYSDGGARAKNLLYNTQNIEDDSTNGRTGKGGMQVDDGEQVKGALYPFLPDDGTTGSSIHVPTSKGGVRVDSGHQTKRALYPSTADMENYEDATIQTNKGGVQVDTGQQVKDALYPSASNLIAENSAIRTSIARVHVDEGEQAKLALYPSTAVESENVVVTGKGGVQIDSGHQVKNALYPYSSDGISEEINFQTSKGSVHVDSGHQVKDVLYPSASGVTDTQIQTNKGGMQIDSGYQVKDALYPSTSDENTGNVMYKRPLSGMYSEGTETKSLLYPTQQSSIKKESNAMHLTGTTTPFNSAMESTNVNRNANETAYVIRETFTEGTETKSILYPDEVTTRVSNAVEQSRQFEKTSTMQHLLYPDTYDYDTMGTKEEIISRGFEPPTKIKEMMYPVVKEEVKTKHEVAPLRPEDVWMDLTVEPYVDDFSIIDKDPHPYKSFETDKSYSDYLVQSEKDDNADAIKKLPLETIIKRSLTTPIQAQISLVNKAVMKYFMDELHIRDHFDAFRKFLLLEDGEFGHSLCSQLFQKISSGMKPQEFCNTIRLNNVIIEALRLSLYASRIEYSTQLTFSLKSVPEVFQPSDVGVFDFLELRYQVPWPCNIIITENSITKYNKVFSFLIRLKRANWSLQEVWVNLKKAGHSRKAATSPQLRQLHLFRHEMQHFVNNLERYTVNQILHVSWEEFQRDLEKEVNSLDDLHRCHTMYQKKIIFRSLLSRNAAPVYKIINDIFGMISKFEARLGMTSWVVDERSGHVTNPLFAKLQQVHSDFRQCIDFLFSVISKLVRRGYQDHLADLLLQVNFNSHYSTAVIHN